MLVIHLDEEKENAKSIEKPPPPPQKKFRFELYYP